MRLLSLNILYGLAALIVYKLVSAAIVKRRRNAEAKRRGCGDTPVLPTKDPLGLLRLREVMKADREKRAPQYVMGCMDEMGKNVNTVWVRLLGSELLVTRDPENVKALFAAQFNDFDIGSARADNFMPLLGEGIFTSQGEPWRHSRALTRPQFAHDQVTDLELEENHVQALFGALKTGKDGWTGKVDLQPIFYNFTLDTATEFLYGQSVHALDPSARKNLPTTYGMEAPNQAEFGHHMDESKTWIQKRAALSKLYWLIPKKRFAHHCAEVHKYVDWFVQIALTQPMKHQPTEPGSKKKFILVNELAEHCKDPLKLRNETLHILAAGRDTTGALLGWMFYLLARNPRVFQKLRNIILSEFGTGHTTEDITFQKLQACQYLRWTIDETLRVAAVVAMNERVCSQDTTLPRGGGVDGLEPTFVPKGTHVLISKYSMQHRRDIWGPDVEEFKPERFDGRKVGWEFVPFGGGPRQCLGRECRSSRLIINLGLLTIIASLRKIRQSRRLVRHCANLAAV